MAQALRAPARSSVASTPVNRGLPMTPLKAEARAATSKPGASLAGIRRRARAQAERSCTSTAMAPSGPTLAPERSEQSEVSRAPGKVR